MNETLLQVAVLTKIMAENVEKTNYGTDSEELAFFSLLFLQVRMRSFRHEACAI